MLPQSGNLETAVERIKLIKRSLLCFALGFIALIPGLGVPFAIGALVTYLRTAHAEVDWNPAGRYLLLGLILAVVGLVTSVVIACLIVLYIAEDAGWIG
jgi:hypothetical protein